MALYAWDLDSVGCNLVQMTCMQCMRIRLLTVRPLCLLLAQLSEGIRRLSSDPCPPLLLSPCMAMCEMCAPELQVVRYRAARARPLGTQRRAGGLGAGSPPRRLQPRRVADLRRHCRVLRGKAKF